MHRVADPERAEHEHIVAARDRFPRRVPRIVGAGARGRQTRPLAAHRKYVARGVVAEYASLAGGEVTRPEGRGPTLFHEAAGSGTARLCRVHLPFELHDARDLSAGQRTGDLQVLGGRIRRLKRQRGRTRVGHQVHARWTSRLGIDCRRHAVLADEQTDAEVLVRRVFRIGEGTRPPEHRNGRRRALQAVCGIRVATGRIAHDFDGELRVDGCTVSALRRPWQADAEQAALEEERM